MPDHVATLYLIAAAVLAVIGALAAWHGRRRRVGQTPHCRRCDYILIRTDGRCPECGAELSPAQVVHGERRRRPAWVAAAGVLLLAGGAGVILPLAGVVGHVDWYRLRRVGML